MTRAVATFRGPGPSKLAHRHDSGDWSVPLGRDKAQAGKSCQETRAHTTRSMGPHCGLRPCPTMLHECASWFDEGEICIQSTAQLVNRPGNLPN